jgi:hypothetical protein
MAPVCKPMTRPRINEHRKAGAGIVQILCYMCHATPNNFTQVQNCARETKRGLTNRQSHAAAARNTDLPWIAV